MGGEISIEGLSFGFADTPLFRDFGFASRAQRILIRGPSGCGKTTLLKIIAGILTDYSASAVLRPQPDFTVLQSDGLAPWLTGRENIELFSHELWLAVAKSDLFPLIERFVERRAVEMSFGQRRSVEVVRALVSQRPLLLLDEPLNFLDRGRRQSLLAFMADETRCPSQILMTSHYEDNQALRGAEAFEFDGDPLIRRRRDVRRADTQRSGMTGTGHSV